MYEKGRDEDILRELGDRIREYRKGKGFSQEKLAELANLHPTYISHLETGKANPSLLILSHIAEALGAHVCELVSAKEKTTLDKTLIDIQSALDASKPDQKVKILGMLEAVTKFIR